MFTTIGAEVRFAVYCNKKCRKAEKPYTYRIGQVWANGPLGSDGVWVVTSDRHYHLVHESNDGERYMLMSEMRRHLSKVSQTA